MVKYDATGEKKIHAAAVQHAIQLLRMASNGGAQKATKAAVKTAAALSIMQQSSGKTVLSMRYFKDYQSGAGDGAITLPPEYFGRTSKSCGVFTEQCGGSATSMKAKLIAAVSAEGIPSTRFAVDEALAASKAWVTDLIEPNLRAMHPRKRSWTAADVSKVVP